MLFYIIVLTKQEESELIRLLGKMKFPVSQELFFAWSKTGTTVSADVIVMRKTASGYEAFLTYRDDPFFKGWHVPGSIRLPSEKWDDTLKRVLVGELGLPADTKTDFFKWFDHPYGTKVGENPRGSVISIYSTCMDPGNVTENDIGRFFPVSKIPKNILTVHIPIMKALAERFSA